MEIKNRVVIVHRSYEKATDFNPKDAILIFPDRLKAFICPFDFYLGLDHNYYHKQHFYFKKFHGTGRPAKVDDLIEMLEFNNAEELNYNEVSELFEG